MSDSAISAEAQTATTPTTTTTATTATKPVKAKRSKAITNDAKARKRRTASTALNQPATNNNNHSTNVANNGNGTTTTSSATAGHSAENSGNPIGTTADEPLCICRALVYDENRFMILCDGCGQWFHGDCVDVEETTAEFLDKYYCPHCTAKGMQVSWRKECHRNRCTHAARDNSKYCSDICGIRVALLHRHTNQLDSRKELEAFGNDVERQALDDLSTRAAYIQKDLERIHRRQSRLETCIERATATAPDQCGFTDDVYLASDDEIDNDNDDTTTAQQITSNAGPCQESRKTCRRHRGWIELKRVDIAKELSVQQMKAATYEHQMNTLYATIQERKMLQELATTASLSSMEESSSTAGQ